MLHPPTFKKGQVLTASDLNEISAAISSIIGRGAFVSAAERGVLHSRQSIPRGLLSGAAMVSYNDPQGGGAPYQGVMAVEPAIGVARVICCAGGACARVCTRGELSCGYLVAQVLTDCYGRPQHPVLCVLSQLPCSRFREWDPATQTMGLITVPLAKVVPNCVVRSESSAVDIATAFSVRNIPRVDIPTLYKNAPVCIDGSQCITADVAPATENAVPLLEPLPGTNTTFVRRLGVGGGLSLRTLAPIKNVDPAPCHGALVALVSGVQFDHHTQDCSCFWYQCSKPAVCHATLSSSLEPVLYTWSPVARFRLSVAVPKEHYDASGYLCSISVQRVSKTVTLEAYQQYPHIIQFRFEPQNYEFACTPEGNPPPQS